MAAAVISAILLVSAFWFVRRQRYSAVSRQRSVNLLQDAEVGNEEDNWHDLPQHYVPDPFLVPDSTTGETFERASTHGHPLSMLADMADVQRPARALTTTTTTTRKSASLAVPQVRPVNIIQHDDAGPSEDLVSGQAEPEIIELPPAYSNIHQLRRSSLASSSTPTGDRR